MPVKRRTLPDGTSILSLNRNETDYLYKEIFQDQAYILQDAAPLPERPVIFDVGANIGLFALFAAQRWPESTIFAFEPVPQIFRVLERNVSDLPRVTPHNAALGKEKETRHIVYYPRYTMMSGFDADAATDRDLVEQYVRNVAREIPDPEKRAAVLGGVNGMLEGRFEQERVPVKVERLSDLLAYHDLDRIDLLKVDVEGSELEVLRGIDEATWPRLGSAVVEVADRDGERRAIEDIFGRHGMRTSIRQLPEYRGTNLFMIFAER